MSEPAKKEGASPMKIIGIGLAIMLVLIFIGIGMQGLEPALNILERYKTIILTTVAVALIAVGVFGGSKKDGGGHG